MVDRIGAAIAVLLFFVGILTWVELTGAIPWTVPASFTAIAIAAIGVGSLVAYTKIHPAR